MRARWYDMTHLQTNALRVRWDESSVRSSQEMVETGGRASEALQAFHRLLGGSNMMAYVVSVTTMMYLRMTWLWLLA